MSSHVVSWVLRHSMEELSARLVLLGLAEHAGGDGADAFPSVETLVRETRLSRRTVQTALRDLEARGAITKQGEGPRGTTNYTVNMGGADIARGAIDDAEGRNLQREGGADIAPEPKTEPKTEPSSAGAGQQTAMMPEPMVELFAYWNQRRGREEKLTDKHRRVLKNALKVRSLDQCKRAIDGLFANPWWRQTNHLELRFALAGKEGQSDAERIDRMVADAEQHAGNSRTAVRAFLDTLPDDARAIAKQHMETAVGAYRSGTPDQADYSLECLARVGISAVIEDGHITNWTYELEKS